VPPRPPAPGPTARDHTPASFSGVPVHVKLVDPFASALAAVAREGGDDADDLALRFTVATEHLVLAAARAGARDAHDAGLPGDSDEVGEAPVDAIIALMQPYAAEIAAIRDLTGDPPEPDPELLARVRGVARSAGVVAAVEGTDWRVVQRFGTPYCPRWGCYGRDGSVLDAARIADEGLPPYGDGCNCHAEAAPPPEPDQP
jgi:hypothetical protein